MTMQIPLRCRCGLVRGHLSAESPSDAQRSICYCDDCQVYALHLGKPDALDDRGGTEAVLATPAQLTLSEGAEQVRCVRLSPKGPYRWYAGCCNAPLCNTLKAGLPFAIVVKSALDFAATGSSPDQLLGPIGPRIHGRFAKGGVPAGAHPKVPLALLPLFLGRFARDLIKRRAWPSPFFDERGAPRAEPRLIDKSERERLRAQVRAAASG